MGATGFLDACGFIPTSGGTGNFVVSSAIVGYQTPASAGAVNAGVYAYRAESPDKSQWEEGYLTYTVSGTTAARTTITANSLGTTAAVNFSAAPNVFITALSADLQNAALLTSNTLPDARLSTNIPRLAATNQWATGYTQEFLFNAGSSASLLTTNAQNYMAFSTDLGPAFFAFHRSGSYAINCGLNTNNYWYLGGWSDGSGASRFGVGPSGDVLVPYSVSVSGISAYAQGAIGAKNAAKAWVAFNGTTGTMLASYNMSSVTRTGTGSYTLNFSNSLGTTSYSVIGATQETSVASVTTIDLLAAPSSASSFSFRTLNGSGAAVDSPYINMTVSA